MLKKMGSKEELKNIHVILQQIFPIFPDKSNYFESATRTIQKKIRF